MRGPRRVLAGRVAFRAARPGGAGALTRGVSRMARASDACLDSFGCWEAVHAGGFLVIWMQRRMEVIDILVVDRQAN
jgi:hypothetical protein